MNDNFKIRPKPLALAVAIATGSMPATPVLAAAGRVDFAWGEVTVEDANGRKSDLRKGSKLDAGDTVVTERGRAQLRFTDGSFVSLQPKTSFKIDDYNYDEDERGSERSVFSLFRGGLRTITGLIGRRNRSAYRVNTPVATIGIRGTAYKMQFQPDGSLALACDDGSIFAANDGGTTYYDAGDTGVVIDQFTVPTLAEGEDGEQLLVLSPPPRIIDDEEVPVIGDDGTPEQVVVNITDLDADQIFDILVQSGLTPEQAAALVAGVFPGFSIGMTGGVLQDGGGYASAFSFFCNNCEGSPIADVEFPVTADFTNGGLQGWINAMGETANRGSLALVENQSNSHIAWGRWEFAGDGNFDRPGPNLDNFGGPKESLHHVIGRPTNLVALMGAPHNGRFSVLGSTTPTSSDGTPGTFTGGTFFVDFGNDRVDGSVTFNHVGNAYDLRFAQVGAANGTFTAVDGPNLSVTTPCPCCGFGGKVAGLVAGPGAENAGFVYHVYDGGRTFGQDDMFGAVTFQQNPAGPLPPPLAAP